MNLILSVVHGMEYEKVASFLESFVATGSGAQMHLFVCGVSAESVKKMELPGVTIHPFRYLSFRQRQPLLVLWPLWKRLLAGKDFEGKRALGKRVFHLASMRFILYYEFLMEHGNEFENVLLTDSRDVDFQRDPFSDNLGPGLHCFLEAKTQFIGKCPSNTAMLQGSFGPEVLAELADCRVSCSGTTIGDVGSIMAYLKMMIELSASGVSMFGGSDQGVHNFIVHRKLIPSMHLHDNYDSTVFTAGMEPQEAVRWNAAEEIIRDDGKAYPVLHQHERDPAVRPRLARGRAARSNH
jgi:hypothetical protein